MTAYSEIQAVADRIAREFDAEKIILFGSHAYGTPGPNSDVDLLVILPVTGKRWRKAAEIRNRVRSPFPMDLLVRAPDEMDRRLRAGDPFLREIDERGVVRHAKHYARMG
ncbi:MAG: nucleotidyltransferase domain-containing protein [Planctomycetes bacterium]|nr:nucleotidyltransferase domain-containing protein [Planctomycetota bacterium]